MPEGVLSDGDNSGLNVEFGDVCQVGRVGGAVVGLLVRPRTKRRPQTDHRGLRATPEAQRRDLNVEPDEPVCLGLSSPASR